MKLPLSPILVFALVVCLRPTLSTAMELPDAPQEPVRIIFDTDMDTRCTSEASRETAMWPTRQRSCLPSADWEPSGTKRRWGTWT